MLTKFTFGFNFMTNQFDFDSVACLRATTATFTYKNQTQIAIENKKIQKTINQVKLVWKVYQQNITSQHN